MSLPVDLNDSALAGIGVFALAASTPVFNPITQTAIELAPALVAGKWMQKWEIVDLGAAQIAANQAKAEQDELALKKAARYEKISAITVTMANGRVFDGDEKSQDRMARALAAMDEFDTLPWVLHDNTVAVVSRRELRDALRLAGVEMASIWVGAYL